MLAGGGIKVRKEILNAPNNIIKGFIDLDTILLNNLYYKILYNIQRDNRKYIISTKGNKELTIEQSNLLHELEEMGYLKCTLTEEEIRTIIKRRNERTVQSITDKLKILQGAVFRFTTGEHNNVITQTQLIGEIQVKDDGFEINLSSRLYKYLFYNVGIGYTPINLMLFFSFRSSYTRSLYVFLRSWSGSKETLEISLKKLREDVFHLEANKYSDYKRFSEKILKKSIEEINESKSMWIEISERRNRRRAVDCIIFNIKDFEERRIKKEEDAIEDDNEIVYWLDTIAVEGISLRNHLQKKYENHCLESPIVRNLFIKSFEKTIAADRNKGTSLVNKKGNSNIALFDKILSDEFAMHEIAFENSSF